MQHKKKAFAGALLAALLFCTLFAACGKQPLPQGVDESEVELSAEATIRMLNEAQYALLMDTMDDTMKSAATAEEWASAWTPAHEAAGEFLKIKEMDIFGKDGYSVAVVKALYENGIVTFTLSYDDALRCAGLYFK
ncbi:MAG: DUF3887 domain-containing protein [Ruthenibacterium sp.]